MARCGTCGKDWPERLRVCPDDGGPLRGSTELVMGATMPVVSVESFKDVATPGAEAALASVGGRDDEFTAGDMVGDYRVEKRLGQGGMGTVYAAIHPLIGKRAAIKVMAADLCTSAVAVERFLQEARSANTIGHPNIVDVFSFGRLVDGRCYLVMEWLAGETLGARLAREGRLAVADAARVVDAIGRALEAAHHKGIVHRDLKPENVFLQAQLDEAPRVKLLDFGIAKLIGDDGRVERTRTGAMLGTPLYVSPEQARARAVDGRADVYSLGVMLFEMLAGVPPFDADNAMDVIAAHLGQVPPRLATRVAGLPAEVDGLVDRMLAKDAALRPSLPEIRATLGAATGQPGARAVGVLVTGAAGGAPSAGATPGQAAAAAAAMTAIAAAAAGPPVPRRGRGLAMVALVLALLATLVVVAVGTGGDGGATAPREASTSPAADPPPEQPVAPRIEPAGEPAVAATAADPPRASSPDAGPVAAPSGGVVLVQSGVAGARLAIDGEPARLGKELELTAGHHLIEVSAPGHLTFRDTVEIVAGKPRIVPARLRRLTRAKRCKDPRNPLTCD